MSIYPSDVDELRRAISEAAVLVAAATIYAGSPRLEADVQNAAEEAMDLLSAIRDADRSRL